ncbi:HigA family addiction module antitoxin [Stenotrophomonas sp.]|uniref:HigA family addiction module antitoxin n=1 Tax=Stenotrophomonas sp. TaxID=69392 RepID=UPI0028AAA74B|nr:HigA family addiction module antitoxin [Stenotrophomonas sp.]
MNTSSHRRAKRRAPKNAPRSEQIPPLHPGDILTEDFMRPLKLSGRALACAIGVSHTRIATIASRKAAITADTAIRLGQYFDASPWFWMNLQVRFDLEMAEAHAGRILPHSCEESRTW